MKKNYHTLLVILISLIIVSCTRNKVDVVPLPKCDGSTEVTYTNHIEPLIRAKCSTGLGPGTGCHDAWTLTYDGLKTSVDNGSLIRTAVLEKTMPKIPNGFGITELTDEEINWLVCWVENGALEN